MSKEKGYPIDNLCAILQVTRSAYYRWLKQGKSRNEIRNEELTKKIEDIHHKHPDMGYRRIRDELQAHYGEQVNDKRVLRICRNRGIQSRIKWKLKGCTRGSKSPRYAADNILNREFEAEAPNEKWVTDVTELKYYIGIEVHKVYLSALLDLYDRRIVSYQISNRNDNPLVMDTFDAAVATEPKAHPLVHSDRGFQYTSYQFYHRIKEHGMKQSMSRVGKCIDNAPMEGFWGILKREMYYGNHFEDKDILIQTVEEYIEYYNFERVQRKLSIMNQWNITRII